MNLSRLSAFLGEPIVHFVILGAAFFGLYAIFGDPSGLIEDLSGQFQTPMFLLGPFGAHHRPS
jgi:hypothetical protein